MVNDALPARNGSGDAKGDSFEASLERLHEIVTQLEAGELTLDDTIARFQEGSALAQHCLQVIDAAELKVSELSPAIASVDHA
ncbi:MAG: exodeoxyribonuclease VII small subunit [Chloroflexota bacterium]|nr:exodeoxyribonuclease VII small subunit [Chloroflexota bacterium]